MDLLLLNVDTITSNLDALTQTFLESLGIWGAIISCLIITAESILPFLPLCVFITIEFYIFGGITGFIISWIFTCIGCLLAFELSRTKLRGFLYKLIGKKNKKKFDKIMNYIEKVSVSGIAVLVAIPFTPAFLINIACGLSNMNRKKFMLAIAIGKPVMVYFWGYIGTTLIECLQNPSYIIRVGILLVGTFIAGKVVSWVLEEE